MCIQFHAPDRGQMRMQWAKRAIGVLGAGAALSCTVLVSQASAGPACTAGLAALKGARYVGYVEGTFAGTPDTLVVGHLDFRLGVLGGIYHRMVASPKKTSVTVAEDFAGAGVDRVTGCQDVAGSTSEFTLSFVSGGNGTFASFDNGARVRVDGRADPNGKGLRGWFYRAMEPGAR